MKQISIFLSIFIIALSGYGQVLPGTLDVTGMPNFIQSLTDVTKEAGQDDKAIGFETNTDETLISFMLDPTSSPVTGVTSSEQNCSSNVFRYKVYIHRSYSYEFEKTLVEAKTYANSGMRYPEVSPYDNLPFQLLGPRDLIPENGGDYIPIPDDPSRAIKIMEFVGCRRDIPIQFRIQPSTLSPAGISNMEIYYTIVGSAI